MSPEIEQRRQQIVAAEHAVEHQRAHFGVQNEARRQRWQTWKVPLILGGGALLGLLLGRRGSRTSASRAGARHDRHHAHESPPVATVQTAKAAGKAAGLMAGLSIAARVAPVVLPLLQRYLASRRLGGAQPADARYGDRTDWWSVARSVAPLFRR